MTSVARMFLAVLLAGSIITGPASVQGSASDGQSQPISVAASKAYGKPKAPEGCHDTAKWRMQVRQVDANIMIAAGLTSQIWVCEYWARNNPGTRGIKYVLYRGADPASAEAITKVQGLYVAYNDYYDYMKEAVRDTVKEGKWVRLNNMRTTGCLSLNPCALYVEIWPTIGDKFLLMQFASKRVSAPRAPVRV